MYICLNCKKASDMEDMTTTAICKYCSGRVFVKERSKTVRTQNTD